MKERVVRAIGAEKKHIGLYLQALMKWLVLALTDWLPEKLLQETLLARFLLTHSFFSSL